MGKGTLRDSFGYALRGILAAVASGRNMKIHLLATIMAVITGWLLGINRLEWAMITISIFMVLAAETLNTAIEKAVDLVTREYHPLAKQAKNLAAGAVLLTAISAVIIGLLIFGPYLW
ncbi:MAG TPA: diacylglycerol kinase family protein [Syntrophomonas sp.]|nr:diacylglycerol kinase family protein [Syntrophomonas sp.]